MKRIRVKADVYVSTLEDIRLDDLVLKTEIALNSLGLFDIGTKDTVALRFHFHEAKDLLEEGRNVESTDKETARGDT